MEIINKKTVFAIFAFVFLSLTFVSASSVTRSFSSANPEVCSALNVTLDVTVDGGDTFYIIDEIFPAGWNIINPTTGNTSHSGHIKWAVASGASSTQYSYLINTSCVTLGIHNFTGEYAFDDTILYNISGTNSVNVRDTQIPVITLVGSSSVSVEYGSSYTDAGATATDNVDGNLTSSITVTGSVNTSALGSYVLTFRVSDLSGNNATQVNRTVNVVDTTIPVISLLGSNPLNISFGGSYSEFGATATDAAWGNLTSSIVIVNSSVNTTRIGSYNVTYNVMDGSGNNATQVIRTVNVVNLVCQTTADTDVSNTVDLSELLVHLGKWNSGTLVGTSSQQNTEIAKTISFWKIGVGC